uniref:Uncharacterized protein n=1 Tax=Anopheles atroparvus TaxID=41427 RepID=A0A240PKJ0_ANOAO
MKQLVLLALACYVLCVVQCAANSPKPCDTSGIQKKYCVPRPECDPQELIDLRTNVCVEKGLFCCKKKSHEAQNDFNECDSGRGYCVGSSLCTVRTYRMRSNRCPSFEEVCCPKMSVVGQSRTTTTEASTATEALTKPTTEDDEKKTSTQKSGLEDIAITNQDKSTSSVSSIEDSLPTKAATLTTPRTLLTPSTATNIGTEASVTQVPELTSSENVPNIDDKSIKGTTTSSEAPIITSTIATTTTTTAPTTIVTTTVPIRTSSRTTATIKSKDTFTPPSATTIKPDEVMNFIPNLLPELTDGVFTVGECGKRNRHGVVESTIQKDDLAEYGEYPWMAALFQVNRDNGEKRYCCNGALVKEFAIVTTAHCFSLCGSKPANMVVRLGEWIMNSTVEPIPHEDIDVDHMIKHPEYIHSSLINNIAVVVLNRSVHYKPTIQPVCLPSSEEQLGSKENLIATGWGTTIEQTIAGTKKPSKVLKRMDLHNEPFTNCENIIKDKRPFKLHNSFACAGAENSERPCTGDAGAPVVVERRPTNDEFYLYGLVSWGFSCSNKKRKETVVTKVEDFKDWIEEVFENPDSEQYKK